MAKITIEKDDLETLSGYLSRNNIEHTLFGFSALDDNEYIDFYNKSPYLIKHILKKYINSDSFDINNTKDIQSIKNIIYDTYGIDHLKKCLKDKTNYNVLVFSFYLTYR